MLPSIITKNFKTCRMCTSNILCYSTAGQGKAKNADKSEVVPANKNTSITSNYNPSEVTKEDMQWRTPWHEKEGQYYSLLRGFYSEENNVNVMKFIQSPINLAPSAIKKWWLRKKEYKDIFMQQYIPERNQMLGNELAAAHFIVHRGGAVKFFHEDKWIKADSYGNYALPPRYQKDKILQAIDCTDVPLHYEGLSNFRGLKQIEWLSLNGCKHMDDWCMDRVSNIFSSTLIYLDLRKCPQITERGLGALYKLTSLKILLIDDLLRTSSYEMTCLMLQDLNPHLDIRCE